MARTYTFLEMQKWSLIVFRWEGRKLLAFCIIFPGERLRQYHRWRPCIMNSRCAWIGSNYAWVCVFICWGEGVVSLCGHLLPISLVIFSLLLLSQRSLSLYPSPLKTEGRTREPHTLTHAGAKKPSLGGSNRSMDGITVLGYLWSLHHNHHA